MSRAEIAKALGRGTNELYRMLSTLERRNYVTAAPGGDRYMLSLKLLVLANAHPPRRRLLDIAEPIMRIAAQQTMQSCHLALWEDGQIVVASSFASPGDWRLSLRPGAVLGAYNTGSGQAMLAFQSEETRARMLSEHVLVKGEQPMAEEEFSRLLKRIKRLGYARSPSHTARGVMNLAFPVVDHIGNAMATLTSPYLERIGEPDAPALSEVTKILQAAAKDISRQVHGADASS